MLKQKVTYEAFKKKLVMLLCSACLCQNTDLHGVEGGANKLHVNVFISIRLELSGL